jgi:hypothetical protein
MTVAPRPGRTRSGASGGSNAVVICAVLGSSVAAGYLLARHSTAVLHDRMLPWILARSLGLAAYVALTVLVALGIWYRHPWRVQRGSPGPEAMLRAHVALVASTGALLVGHIAASALDSFAGVGWAGAFVPWHATYRPTAVALGTVAFYGIVLVTLSAALAGSIARRVWLPIHSVAAVFFGVSLAHGLLAGSDSAVLWWLYALTGTAVVVLQLTRMLAPNPASMESW